MFLEFCASPLSPRLFTSSSFSIINETAALPSTSPLRLSSNGIAASVISLLSDCCANGKKLEPIHSCCNSDVAASPPITITLSHLPVLIQSSAIPIACVVDVQVALICVFGPLAFMICAKWLSQAQQYPAKAFC